MTYLDDPLIQKIGSALLPIPISDGTDEIKRDGQRRAAILMPLIKRTDWHVILTQRPETMPSHAGQISFPGGKVEDGETARDGALRETEEEVGITPSQIRILGRLPSFDAVSEYRVTPFVGLISPDAVITPDPREVADVFETPFSFLMNPANHKPRTVEFNGEVHRLFDMPYTDPKGIHRNIWGMTAMMIYRLYQRGFAT